MKAPTDKSTKPSKSLKPFAERKFRHAGIAKAFLQRHARTVLGIRNSGKLEPLFLAAAQYLGTTWTPESKSRGYQLLQELCEKTPEHITAKPRKQKWVPGAVKTTVDPVSDEFLSTYAWRSLRMRVLIRCGARCQCCGSSAKDGVVIHVDHIKPRRRFPELALDESNLQVLCEVCNHGKGNWDQTNWSEPQTVELPPERYEPMWSKRVN